MQSAFLFTLFLSFAAQAHGQATLVSPTDKVIQLIEELKLEVVNEGTSEAASYEAFACFCRDTISSKSSSILSGRDNINTESSTIVLKTAEKEDKEKKHGDRLKRQEALAAELKQTHATYDKAKNEYDAEAADLGKAISSLENAIQSMETSKGTGEVRYVEFLDITKEQKSQVSWSLALADSLGLISAPAREKVTAFLQQGAKVDPADSGFRFHSQPIIKLMNELLTDFRGTKSDLDRDFGTTTNSYNRMVAQLNREISHNDSSINQLEGDIDTWKSDIADARGRLIIADGNLKDDEEYIKDLTAQCEVRAKDWDQRSALRAGEIKALTDVLKILNDDVSPMDQAANARAALLQTVPANEKAAPTAPKVNRANSSKVQVQVHKNPVAPATKDNKAVSFLQNGPLVRAHVTKLVQLRGGLSEEARKEKVIALLAHAGKELHSTALASLALRVSADPFAKIKGIIQALIERLLKEGQQEASKKGFCDTEVGKSETDRDFRYSEVNSLLSDISANEAKFDELTEEIGTLTQDIHDLNIALINATTVRQNDHDTNTQTVDDAKAGLKAITNAINILKTFYRKSSRATVLLQYSPVQDDTAGAGFSGEYKGKQDSANGIIGLMDVIKTDFERTIKVTTKDEKEAAAAHVEFDRTSQADIEGKTTTKSLDIQDKDATNNTIYEEFDDLQINQDLLDKALKELVALNPMCKDTTMPYAERVAKRQAEIDQLWKAYCILDTERSDSSECQDDASGGWSAVSKPPVVVAP